MRQPATSPIEEELRRRFIVREESFVHGWLSLRLMMPRAADELLDEEAFAKDERMPYWADLWPSARGLASFLLGRPPRGERVVELGCGLALPSLALRSIGIDVLATDHNIDGLLFARANAIRNGLDELDARLFDWRDPSPPFEPRGLAIAADVLYEQRNAAMLANLLPRVLTPRGRFLLADPGRRWAPDFERLMRESGWSSAEPETIETASVNGSSPPSRIRITEWARTA